MHALFLIFSAALLHNLVLTQYLGLCPFLGASSRLGGAFGLGLASTLVLFLSALLSYFVFHGLLIPYGVMNLSPLVMILCIALSVQFLELLARFAHESFYQAIGIYFPLITVNCAILGTSMLLSRLLPSFFDTLWRALGSGLGFTLVICLLSAARERFESASIPRLLRGAPLSLFTVAIVSMAFSLLESLHP